MATAECLADPCKWLQLVPTVALVVGIWRVTVAQNNNRLVSDNPWIGLVIEYIKKELQNAQNDKELFIQICTIPFKDKEDKNKTVAQLESIRDESMRNLYFLEELAPGFIPLRVLKASITKIDDSYFRNDEIRIPDHIGQKLITEYHELAGSYVNKIRDIAMDRRNFQKKKSKWFSTK